MDGNWITAMRTGAVAAHSMKLFARKDFATLAFIGLGNVARATLEVFHALYPERKMTIRLLKHKNQHELFSERFSNCKNISFEYVDTYRGAIEGSDIIVEAATYLGEDICSFDDIKEGALVMPIHTRGFTAFDYMFDRIFVDDVDHVRGFRNFSKYKDTTEVTDVVNGEASGRQNDKERIIAYNIGIALHDIYFASKIYDMVKDKCMDVDLMPPTEKFWI